MSMFSKYRKGSKGISPMIATVLLIAFTVAVGGILSVWLTTLTATQTGTTGTAAEKQILCARSVLEITEATYGASAAASNVTVTYRYGTETLTNFTFYFIDSTRASAKIATENQNTLNPGDRNVSRITATGLSGSYLQSVRVTALCQTNYPVSGECKYEQACMKKV